MRRVLTVHVGVCHAQKTSMKKDELGGSPCKTGAGACTGDLK